jgi:hypothetical protein
VNTYDHVLPQTLPDPGTLRDVARVTVNTVQADTAMAPALDRLVQGPHHFKDLARRAGQRYAELVIDWENGEPAHWLGLRRAVADEAADILVEVCLTIATPAMPTLRVKRAGVALAGLYTFALICLGDPTCPRCGDLIGVRTTTASIPRPQHQVCPRCAENEAVTPSHDALVWHIDPEPVAQKGKRS